MTAAPTRAAPPPLIGIPLAVISLALAVANFMQVLDSTIANVSVPTIAGDLGVSSDEGTWVITSFAVSNGISVPLTGWAMQRYGVVRTFSMSVFMFTIASFLCGISWNIDSLILFRVLQGAVSGPMIPGSQALLLLIFPPQKRGTALAIWSVTTLVAPICGPIMGGYISDNYAWPWIFFINVPIGLISGVICWRGLASRETPTRVLPIDKIGFALLVIWVGALQVMLDRGKDADWFASPEITVLALVSGIGFLGWVIWEITEKYPIVDLSLLRGRNFAFGTISYCLGYAVFFGNVVLLPLWLQTDESYTATWAGLVMAPSGVVAVFLTPFAARLMNKADARIGATIAFAAFTATYFMRSDFTANSSFWDFVAPNLMMGIGMSLFFVSLVTISLNGIPPSRVPSASGLLNFARITAGSLATSITTTFWDRREALHQSHLVEGITNYSAVASRTLSTLTASGFSHLQTVGVLTQQVVKQAYVLSADDIFWLSGWLSLLMIPLIWLSSRAMSNGGSHAAAD